MPWVRLEAHALRHPKLLSVGAAGMVLYIRALGYAAEHRTDGFIPSVAVESLMDDFEQIGALCPAGVRRVSGRNAVTKTVTPLHPGEDDEPRAPSRDTVRRRRKRLVERMVLAGLWHKEPDGYRVHDYLDYQPSADDVKEQKAREREATRERVRRHRARKKAGDVSGRRPNGNGVTETTIRSSTAFSSTAGNAVTPSPDGAPAALPPGGFDPGADVDDVVRQIADRRKMT